MRLKRSAVALATASLLTLAACGGGGDDDSGASDPRDSVDTENLGNTGSGTDPDREGPVTIEGATEGGTVTVLTELGLTTPLDPSDLYYTDTNAIMTALVTRSLTQYSYDEESGQMILVPDLATDLGTPNEDFTEWQFTLRDGVKWETGAPVTAEEVAFGIVRSMDGKVFPNGPGLSYSNAFFLGGEDYKGPYTDPGGYDAQQAVSVDGNTITVKMSKPFPDFAYYANFPAIGPIPTDPAASDPATYAQKPLATGPYKIDQYTVGKSLTLVRNDQWDPATDPARTAYPDSYVFKAGQSGEQIDQILLNDSGAAKTTLTYDDVLAQDYRKFNETGRLVTGGQPCTFGYFLDQRTVTDKAIAEALTWAVPYEDQIVAAGLIPDVNAVATQNLMPPGVPGREPYDPVEGHGPFETDADKAKQILTDSGNLGYELSFYFRTDSDTDVASVDALTKGLEAAGFTVKALPTTIANYVADRDDPAAPINLRSYGWCSDWPSGASWVPPIFQSTDVENVGLGSNEAVFNQPDVDAQIEEIYGMPAEDQPAAWNALEQEIMTTWLPVVPRYYGGVVQAHGSQIQGHVIDNTLGMPSFRDMWVSAG